MIEEQLLVMAQAEIDKRDAEIERLRADLLTRDGEAQDLQGEVARLRELLLEMMLCQGATTSLGILVLLSPELLRRVREALAARDAEIRRLNGTPATQRDSGGS